MYHYANGNLYDGAWINNERCGSGTLIFRNGDLLVGHFSNNLIHGPGTYTPQGGAPTAAEWIHGNRVVEEVQEISEEEEEEDDDVENYKLDL